jgi:hypothetical protein
MEEIRRQIFSFLKPWETRLYSCTDTSNRLSFLNMCVFLDDRYKRRRRIRLRYHCCNRGRVLNLFDPHMVVQHNCNSNLSICNGGTGRCHQNSDTSSFVFWNFRENQPMKCTFCGKTFVSARIANKVFFLNNVETRFLDVYKFQNRNAKMFEFRDVLFVSNAVNHTLTPMYRYSKQRLVRERWLRDRRKDLENLRFNHLNFFDIETLIMTPIFQNFLNTTHRLFHLDNIFEKLFDVIPIFFEEYESLQLLIKTVFPDMSTIEKKNRYNDVFVLKFKKSVEFCINEALIKDDLQKGLTLMREIAFIEHCKYIKNLGRCLSGCHENDKKAYEQFVQGYITIIELISSVNKSVNIERNRRVLFEYLHSKGIHAERIQCELIDEFIKNESIPMIQVFNCVLYNHVLHENTHFHNNDGCIALS